MFKIHNIRYGFATNSSSAHSVVMVSNDSYKNLVSDYNGQSFGWDCFVLADRESKAEYFGQCLAASYNVILDRKDSALLASRFVGTEIDSDGYVDHQSLICFPKERCGKRLDKRFAKGLFDFLVQDGMVITGGNDNEGVSGSCFLDNIINTDVFWFLDFLKESYNLSCRYDNTGKYWTVFDHATGSKIRMSFSGEFDASKADAPELCDVKITNQCHFGCSFCYQGSTPEGLHANKHDVEAVIQQLYSLGCFEIAIGGGEPTLHPKFIDILKYTKNHNIVPSFSTRNYKWVINNWSAIKDIIGAVGFSISSVKDLKKIIPFVKSNRKVTIQVVVGAVSEKELRSILKICGDNYVSVLLLGWKSVGRGIMGPDHVYNLANVLDSMIKDGQFEGPSLSFDTCLIESMRPWLEKNSKAVYYTVKEGTHSLYVDCVEKKMGKSSFCNEYESIENDGKYKYIKSGCIGEFFRRINS